MKVININQCYQDVEKKFNKKGLELSKHDFYTIVGHVLKVSFLEAKMVSMINSNVYGKIKKYSKKLMTGMPIQYVLKSTNFCGFNIVVDENVLIPRFDTEALIPVVAKELLDGDKVLDMCTGSGAIGIAISKMAEENGKSVKLTISDISPKALKVAKYNCYRNYVDAECIESDLFENINDVYDIIYCKQKLTNMIESGLENKDIEADAKDLTSRIDVMLQSINESTLKDILDRHIKNNREVNKTKYNNKNKYCDMEYKGNKTDTVFHSPLSNYFRNKFPKLLTLVISLLVLLVWPSISNLILGDVTSANSPNAVAFSNLSALLCAITRLFVMVAFVVSSLSVALDLMYISF